MLTPFSKVPTTNGQAPAGKTVKTVTGRFIAKATVNYASWHRAEDAVRWLKGELQIKPTAKLAAETFRVNAQQVKEARERLERRERGKRQGYFDTPVLSPTTRSSTLLGGVGPERILRVIDKLTEPALPLVAAE